MTIQIRAGQRLKVVAAQIDANQGVRYLEQLGFTRVRLASTDDNYASFNFESMDRAKIDQKLGTPKKMNKFLMWKHPNGKVSVLPNAKIAYLINKE